MCALAKSYIGISPRPKARRLASRRLSWAKGSYTKWVARAAAAHSAASAWSEPVA